MSQSKPTQYYGLRLIRLIYQMLCLLTVIVALGGLGYISLHALNSPAPDRADFELWLPQALGLVIGGGLLALTFYVIAQVIEVQLSINAKMNVLLKSVDSVPAALQAQEASNQKVLAAIKGIETSVQTQARAARLQATTPPPASSSSPTKTIP